jgi:hypothetical protein
LEDVYAIARPVTVTIKDAPVEGRPASYSGAIGRFQWESRLVPTEAKAGDPLTLTLTLRGEGTLDAVAVPELAQDPQVAESFKVYEATEESSEDQRRFIYGLRPLRAGIEAFPPVSLTYFDVAKDQYIQLQSAPIPLQIGQAEQLSGEEIDVSANAAPASGEQIETQAGGIFANDSALRSLRNEAVDPVRWFAGLGSLAGVYLIAVVLNQKLRRLSGDPDLVRRRGAASRARRRLHQAAVDSGSDSQQTDRLQAAFAGLVADALGIPEAGLTLAEVRSRLKQWELDPELDARFGRWCEACDAVRYGATSGAVDRLQQEARQLMDDLVRCLKRKRILR